jgi:prepilin-type N-terminal cleavage/methylation domain-containing protein
MRCSTIARTRGFTLIELVAVLVIVGALVALAVPAYQSIRWEARKATLDNVRAAMRANMMAARAAYVTQGLGPGSTVQVNGQAIEVFGEGAMASTYAIPAGSPTGQGMYRMIGCGTDTPSFDVVVPCVNPPGFLGIVGPNGLYLWPRSTGAVWAETFCAVFYAGYVASLAQWNYPDTSGDRIGTIGWHYKPSDPNPTRAAGAC